MILVSQSPLSEHELDQVRDILRESNCPHESLANSFERYRGLCGHVIFFDDNPRTITTEVTSCERD